MLVRRIQSLILVALTAGATGFGVVAMAQDDPFSSPASAEASSPFDVNNAAAPAPAAAAAPFEPNFGGNTAAPAAGESDPFANASNDNPFAMDNAAAPAPPSSGAAADSNPFANTPASDSGSFFGSNAPATAPAAAGSGSGIATLYDFRFVKKRTFSGKDLVTRQRMTTDEAREWDKKVKDYYARLANDGQLAGFVPGQDSADEWADWLLYAVQCELWVEYCNQVALVGMEPEVKVEDLQWPGEPKPGEQQQSQNSGRPQAPENIINENRSLDDQLMDFSPVPDTRGGNGAKPVIDPSVMDDQMAGVYKKILTQLREFESQQQEFVAQLDKDLSDREQNRLAYAEWRQKQRDRIVQYVDEWSRRYEGKVVLIAGVRYELYRPGSVPTNVPRGANIVETNFDLTPYDLLNEDGTLRGPAR